MVAGLAGMGVAMEAAMAVAGTIENREGSACQQADGSWRSSDDELG